MFTQILCKIPKPKPISNSFRTFELGRNYFKKLGDLLVVFRTCGFHEKHSHFEVTCKGV